MMHSHPWLCLWLALGVGVAIGVLMLAMLLFDAWLEIVADDTLEDPDIEMGAVCVPHNRTPQVADAPEMSGSAGAS